MRQLQDTLSRGIKFLLSGMAIIALSTISVSGQSISGNIFLDYNMNGINDDNTHLSTVLVNAYSKDGNLEGHAISDMFGNYTIGNLDANESYRIEFKHDPNYFPGKMGPDNKSSVVFADAGSTNVDFGLVSNHVFYGDNPEIAITCFVQGNESQNGAIETVVAMPHQFNEVSAPRKIADKDATGSVWGMAYHSKDNSMYTASFIKQYANIPTDPLTNELLYDAIYKTDLDNNNTVLFTRLKNLGITLPALSTNDEADCDYGNYVGRAGLGAIEISDDEKTLYAVNISNKSVVAINTKNPTASNTRHITNIDPVTSNNARYPFALKYYKDKLYIGITETTEVYNNGNSASSMDVIEYDLNTNERTVIFSSNYNLGQWTDDLVTNFLLRIQHWLTDIEFLDDDTMILGLNDRKGNRYCNSVNNIFHDQKGDILMVFKGESGWELENAGVVNGRTGVYTSNGQGPGGGEFFGADFFPFDKEYHNEVSLGSVLVVPGQTEVVNAVFDPLDKTYSAGFQRYSSLDGSILAANELYTFNYEDNFGKATGLGGMVMIAPKPELEIGNLVWIDSNKDGHQDSNESGAAGISLELYDNNCTKVGETQTDANGYYVFNSSNVDLNNDNINDELLPYNTYYVVIAANDYDKVTSSIEVDDITYILTDLNSTLTSNSISNDNDAVEADEICNSIDGLPYIQVNTKEVGKNNHTFDIGLKTPGDFDLALKKELISNEYARIGEKASFKITVINQGQIGAKNIVVADLLAEGYRFETTGNDGWSQEDNELHYTIDKLAADTQTEIFIHLYIKAGYSYEDFINYAEIKSADDQFNKPGNDIDSNPGGTWTDDQGGEPFQATDNEVEDSGEIDEDDHDPAALKVFDLALTKKLVNAKSAYLKNDVVNYEITVINQGNVAAKNVHVTDYLPEGLGVDNAEGWSILDGNYDYTIPTILPNSRAKINISVRVLSDDIAINIVNIAEISQAYIAENVPAVDYDSTPDTDKNDDEGGNPFDGTDNEVDDHGEFDEDDHDPAVIKIERFDLALLKTTKARNVQVGAIVEFDITVVNQGSITANEVKIVDYLPTYLEYVETEGWEIDQATGHPVCTLSKENGLLPSYGLSADQTKLISIKCRVKENTPVGRIINEAEIVSSKDFNGIDRSFDDFDSTPDILSTNDNGGEVNSLSDDLITDIGTFDEDDHDPAPVVVMAIMAPQDCYCLSNSTEAAAGQFVNVIEIESVDGETWEIIDVVNLEQGLAAPNEEPDNDAYIMGEQAVTTPFVIGAGAIALLETSTGPGTSTYSMEGISLDGEPFAVTLSNGATEVVIEGGPCNYNEQIVSGPAGVCAGNLETYCVPENTGSTYSWTLSAGGTIVAGAGEACIMVEWDAVAGGPFTLAAEQINEGACLKVAELEVNVGLPGGAMACISDANISLDSDCSIEVTPELVLQGEIGEDQVYEVLVIDPQGNMLAEPVITGDYIGQKMTIKVRDVCSGNSCWTSITVNDKMKPTVMVEDAVADCNAILEMPTPVGMDNCGGVVTVEMIEESTTKLSCDDDYTFTVTRVYQATDESGNVSDLATQIISLARINLDSIVFPIDRTVGDDNPLFCQDFIIDDEGNPSPTSAGVPTYNGSDIFPYQDEFCGFGIDYEDNVISPNGCVEKVMRTWTAFEWWCGQAIVRTHVQEINIADQAAPQFEMPENITVSTNTNSCSATVTLPTVSPVDDCSETFEVDVQYPDGFLNNTNGGTVELELGENQITYTVYDGCLNSSSQTFTVTVRDNTPPVMVCDQNTVISLKADGTAYAPASVFDNGSVTDCSPLTFSVRRMDNGSACGLQNFQFGEFVEFCCSDIGETVQIILRAEDEDGNVNTCMVNTIIQDKNAPVIAVPANVTIQCTDDYDLNDLSEFGVATASDNCMDPTITESAVETINDCNIGTIVRTFIASDGNGTDVGTQVIFVENNSLFTEADIDWPDDFSTDEGCNAGDLSPESLGEDFAFPRFTTDACDMVEFAYTEQDFQTSDNACFKIIRRWMVMDMCQLDLDGNPTIWLHDQTIVVTNSVDPVINSSCDPVSVTVTDNCDEGEISLSASATDDCTADENLVWTYNIDLDNNGSFDVTDMGTGTDINITSTFPIGSHRIVYQWEDRCGNSASCTQEFNILNGTFPTAYCQDLAIELTPMDTDGDNIEDAEMVFLDVALVGGNSSHPCGFPVTLSYNEEGDSTEAVFDCFNLGPNIVTVYVTDPSGNISSCDATIIVQDNNDVDICPSPEDCIVWPSETVDVTTCVENLDPSTLNSEASVTTPCVCGDFDITYVDGADMSDPTDACFTFERTWTVTFNCFALPLEYTFVQTINQLNASAPVITNCPSDASGMATDATCTVFVGLGIPTVSGACSFGLVTTNNSQFANNSTGSASGNYPVGTTDVIYTVTDACGNATTCLVQVIVDDLGVPVCNTNDVTVFIPASGNEVTIANDLVDNNSQDDCGMIVEYSTSPNTFDCTNLGDNTVIMTVTDQSGNTSTCEATVTVQDLVAPICNTQDITITLNSVDDVATIIGTDVNDGSTDACGNIVSYDVSPNSFTCAEAGDNTVVLTVTDNNGNTSQCNATVTVEDGVAPICAAQDITITLDENGMYTLTATEVDNGSADVCGTDVTLAVSPDSFDCTNLGANTVTLTVTDGSGNSTTCDAIVTVEEDTPPVALCNTGIITFDLFTSNPSPIPTSIINNGSFDACGEIVEMVVEPSIISCDDIGLIDVVLTVTDNSGNTASCTSQVMVGDNVPPVAVAQDITVAIEMNGTVTVEGIDLENGSTDACGEIVNYMVTPNVFTCDSLGDNQVVFKVTDNSGNTATADATVTVVSMDELVAVCQDTTIFLDEFGFANLTPEMLNNGSMAPCGATISLSITQETFLCNDAQQNPHEVMLIITDDVSGEMDTCTSLVTVLDTLSPVITCPADLTFDCTTDLSDPFIYGDVLFNDNCPGSIMMDTIIVEDLNECGLGTITRTYIGEDLSGNSGSCVQTITIEVAEANLFTEANIVWPETPITIGDCSTTDPEGINSFPTIDTLDALCFSLTIEHTDMSVGMGTACLDTIERTWTVTDVCQLDGVFTFVQTLFIDDSAVPLIVGIPTDTIIITDDETCGGFLDLSGASAEDCTAELVFTNDSPVAADNNSLDASGVYPTGTTVVNYTATDACGNTGTFQITISIVDETEPAMDCVKVFPEITDALTVTVQPEDYVATLFDNCTDSMDISLFFVIDYAEGDTDFSDNIVLEELTFDCDDVGILQVFFLAAVDEAGNVFVCGSQTTVVDPNNFCGNVPPTNLITGTVETYYGEAVNTTEIILEGTMDLTEVVEEDGTYAIADLPTGTSVDVTPLNNNEPTKGLSTLDILIIQKHIMNSELLPTPYDIIAADANHSEDVTGADIIVIQKLILGDLQEFPDNNSFRFIDANYEFLDPLNPLMDQFPESNAVPYVYGTSVQDFVGVKIGDVNGTYQGFEAENGPTAIEILGRSFHNLHLGDVEVNPTNGIVELPIYSDEYNNLQALEMTMNMTDAEIIAVKPALIDITDQDYAIHNRNSELKISWFNDTPIQVEEREILFTLVLRTNNKVMPNDVVEMTQDINEFYRSTNDIAQLRFKDINEDNNGLRAVLHQNLPNPWANSTTIDFEMVNDADYQFYFYDIDGKLLHSVNGFANKGLNKITVDKTDLNAHSGIIVYEFVSQSRKLTKRMMLIE